VSQELVSAAQPRARRRGTEFYRRLLPATGAHRNRPLGSVGRALAGLVLVLACWQLLAVSVGGHPASIPTPFAVLRAGWHDRHLYAVNASPTLLAAAVGYAIGNAAAIVLGVAIAALPAGRREAMATMVALYNVPVIAVAPLLEVLLSGKGPEIATAAIAVFFTTLVATTEGLLSADPLALDVVRAYGGGGLFAARKVRVWYAVPRVFAGLAVAVPFAVVGAILGEFLGGQEYGLGVMLVGALSNLDAARVWGICLLIGALGAVGVAGSTLIGTRLAPWGTARSDPTPARRGPLIERAAHSVWSAGLTVLALLGLWVGGVKLLDLQPYVVRMPWDVWRYLVSSAQAGANRRQLVSALVTTFGHALEGCAVGLVLGVAIAVAFARWRSARRVALPFVVVLSAVPHLALVPVLTLILGHGLVMTLAVAALIALLPTVINVEAGLRSTPAAYHDLMRVSAAGRWQTLRMVDLPQALPHVFTSLRIAAPWALLGVLYAEWLASGQGIGAQMVQQAAAGNYDGAWSSALAITVVAVLLYLAVDRQERLMRGTTGISRGLR